MLLFIFYHFSVYIKKVLGEKAYISPMLNISEGQKVDTVLVNCLLYTVYSAVTSDWFVSKS